MGDSILREKQLIQQLPSWASMRQVARLEMGQDLAREVEAPGQEFHTKQGQDEEKAEWTQCPRKSDT